MPRSFSRYLLFLTFTLLGSSTAQSEEVINPKKAYAFLVACDVYEDPDLRRLKFSKNDIISFQNILLESRFLADNLILLHGDQPDELKPTRERIDKQLSLVLEKLDEESTLIVAFSGHGVQFVGDTENFFCPHDTDLKDRKSLISLDDVFHKIGNSKAKRKLLLVDACRNDPRLLDAKSLPSVRLDSVTRPETKVPKDIVALFSCDAGQESQENEKLQHSVFFYHFMKGWTEGAVDDKGTLRLDRLVDFTVQQTKLFATREMNKKQSPVLRNRIEESWVMSRFSGEIRRLKGPKTHVHSVQLVNNGRWVAACSRGNGEPDTTTEDDPTTIRPELFIWDAVSGRELKRFTIRAGVT